MTSTLTWGAARIPVPFVAVWSEETVSVNGLISRGGRLAYRDETSEDRDPEGVLWARMSTRIGEGRPDFGGLHPARQRQAMLEMRCQVCGGPASRTRTGWLFVMPRPRHDEAPRTWPEGERMTAPPVCEPCAAVAMLHCPHLRDPIAIRARRVRPWGAFGGVFLPTPAGLVQLPTDNVVPYRQEAARWCLASQLVVELTRCTVIPDRWSLGRGRHRR
jgi:hypothetical protein